ADKNIKDKYGKTPSDWSNLTENPEAYMHIEQTSNLDFFNLIHFAQFDENQKFLNQLLMQEAENKDLSIFKKLVEFGANPALENNSSFFDYVLHKAAFYGNLPLVEYLVEEQNVDV